MSLFLLGQADLAGLRVGWPLLHDAHRLVAEDVALLHEHAQDL
jgi:hypothetical protein